MPPISPDTAITQALAQARTLRWDTWYRFIASLFGIAAVASIVTCVAKPSDAVRKVDHWAGVSNRQVEDVSRWLSDPARSTTFAGISVLVLILGLIKLRGARAVCHQTPSVSIAPSTTQDSTPSISAATA
jgi:hypothetical protein